MFTDEQVNEWRAKRTTDRLLDSVLDIVLGDQDEKEPEGGLPVTVSVKGQMISGYAVTGKALAEAAREQIGEGLGSMFDGHLQLEVEVRGLAAAEAEERGLLTPAREYLHLRNVTIPGFKGIQWMRVRLDSVDAWTLGAP